MNDSDQEMCKAFVLAAAQLEPPIAPEVQAGLHQVHLALKQSPQGAIAAMDDLLSRHSQLSQLSAAALDELARDKYLLPGLGNVVARPSSQATKSLGKLSADLEAIAHWVMEQISDTPNGIQDAFVPMFKLKTAVAEGKARLLDFAVLRAIEQRPLTTEDLAYRLEMPFDQVNCVVQRLWQEGKINTMGSGIWRNIFPFLNHRKRPNSDAYWMLTSIGHFRLHPIISLRQMGVH